MPTSRGSTIRTGYRLSSTNSSRAERPDPVAWARLAPRSILVTLALAAITACGSETPQRDPLGAIATAPPESGVTGVLNDQAGRPLAGERVLACQSRVCVSSQTGANGRFTFSIDPPAQLVIKTDEQPSALPRRGAAMVPVHLAGKSLLDIGGVVAPDLPNGTPVGSSADPQTVHAGDGLELTVRASALTPRLGEIVVDIAARRLTGSQIPHYLALVDEEVLAVYALHPFAAKSASPIAVRASSSLPAGTAVKFRTINEMDGTFSAPVSGRATGTFVSTDALTGISELTYVVISR